MSVVSPAGHCGPLETCNPLSARLVTNNNTDSLGKLRCLTLLASLDSLDSGLTLVAGGKAPGGDGGDGPAPRHRHVVEAEHLVRGAGVKHRAGEHHRLVTLAWEDTENVNSVSNLPAPTWMTLCSPRYCGLAREVADCLYSRTCR